MIYKTLHIKLRWSNTYSIKHQGWTQVLWKSEQFLLR
jgi:hypothetical protein